MEQLLSNYLSYFRTPEIKAVAVFIVYVAIAKIADIVTTRILRRITKFTTSSIDDRLIELLHRPVFFSIIVLGISHSISMLSLSEHTIFYSKAVCFSLLTVMWCVCIIKISNLIIDNTVDKVTDFTGLSRELTPLIGNVWTVVLIIGSVMFILSVWEVDITPLLASAGIVGVAVALAAKDTLANFFGGVSIFVDKPYKIGDYIVLDRGERGEVAKIGIRSTRIKTRDDILISIPNSIIANTKIINESAPVPDFRIRIPVSVAYGTDIDKVEAMLIEIAESSDNIQDSPEARVRFRTFGDSSLNMELLCWAKEPAVRGLTIHEINREIYKKFNEQGVQFPFPHRTVYVREETNWQKQ